MSGSSKGGGGEEQHVGAYRCLINSMATVPSSRELVLKLYRQSLRHADKLVYTDKSFYKMRLRNEFQKAKEDRGKRSLRDIKKLQHFVTNDFGGVI
ncbi:PREDICTED: uncharacterized protein LOC109581288 [Amphimedon queenslandica]|uniref:Complex 1 LYR protein domain-containing protein n=1 Tax=Amphimedon queenslandica TaxID=400682 RepID=A0AAN0J293_AMPQE|nr:PREDICTED: uncharacterized protein LOC109581288 [Amphimedon queenslandica]|eukprot:XP_019850841.1 PREDICTED: uncharacterized protein LOC109581288 [Amphimedon queenslandica]